MVQVPHGSGIVVAGEVRILLHRAKDLVWGPHDVNIVLNGRELDPWIASHSGLHGPVDGSGKDDGAQGRALGSTHVEALEQLEILSKPTGVHVRGEAGIRVGALG